MKYVNCYEVERRYGGPEEGGWWYTAGTPVASIPVADATEEKIEAIRKGLHDRHSAGNYSSNVRVYVEDASARPFPRRHPRYQ